MARHKSRAFILDIVDYRETSSLAHVLCENEGRISLVARGLRSTGGRKRSIPEPFTVVQITYTLKEGASLGNLTGIESERVFPGIRSDLVSYALANFWFEAVNASAQARQASPEVFAVTESALAVLNDASGATPALVWHFGRLLGAVGFGLELGRCSRCGRTSALEHFDLSEGSVFCSGCAGSTMPYYPVGDRLARTAAEWIAAPAPVGGAPLSPAEARAFLVMVEQFLAIHLEHRFRSFPFLLQSLPPA
jgi:DNA repair protein RecO (recombination protein O)